MEIGLFDKQMKNFFRLGIGLFGFSIERYIVNRGEEGIESLTKDNEFPPQLYRTYDAAYEHIMELLNATKRTKT